MGRETAGRILQLLDSSRSVEVLDLTGGAPELNPNFRHLVEGAIDLGRRVIDRCNLTVLLEPGQEDTAAFLAAKRVELVASLPCYEASNVDRQRGRGVFDKSVRSLRLLNRLGYGQPGSELLLSLVFNPGGPSLPPPQAELEAAYKRELESRFGIRFHRLLTITNMPILRFADQLERDGGRRAYQSLLESHFNPTTVPELMCRRMLSVGYDGRLYDCDFNQMLELDPNGGPQTVWDIASLDELTGRMISTASHCFGCTAGAGSSCGGAIR